MKIIGDTIQEAIDWTQDVLRTTRPLAERTLFSLLMANSVKETEDGFVLTEDEEETTKHFQKVKNNLSKNWKRPKIKFHSKRKSIHQQNMKKRKFKMDSDDSANDMLDDSLGFGSSESNE